MHGISKLDPSVITDNGCCIVSRYVTYAFADAQDRERLQLGDARALYPYALALLEGSGQVAVTVWAETIGTLANPNPYPPFTQAPFTLANPAISDTNVPLNVTGNRAFLQFDSYGSCSSWSLKRVDLAATSDPRMLVTGQ